MRTKKGKKKESAYTSSLSDNCISYLIQEIGSTFPVAPHL